jgi:hypothetical protein
MSVVVDDHKAAGHNERIQVFEAYTCRFVPVAVDAQHGQIADPAGRDGGGDGLLEPALVKYDQLVWRLQHIAKQLLRHLERSGTSVNCRQRRGPIIELTGTVPTQVAAHHVVPVLEGRLR